MRFKEICRILKKRKEEMKKKKKREKRERKGCNNIINEIKRKAQIYINIGLASKKGNRERVSFKPIYYCGDK